MQASHLSSDTGPGAGLTGILEKDAEFEQLATGFEFVEGPAWHPGDQCLVFSDIIGNTMYRWSENAAVSVFRKPSNMSNGNAWDHEGRLVSCEHASSCVSRVSADGGYEVLASHYQGQELNSPNDIIVTQQGSILFTDPNSGRGPVYGVARPQQLGFQGVYRLNAESGELALLVDDFAKPNGLCLSRDEKQLFINDSDRQHIRVFDVLADGRITNGKIWASVDGDLPGVADGMKVDSAGNLYCCGSGGIHVFDTCASLLGVIPTPEFAANFTWGGEDLTDLLITAKTSIYRLRVKIPGFDPRNSQSLAAV
jgi:gluconolactonase